MGMMRCELCAGSAVKMAETRGCALSDLSVADLQSIHPLFADDVTQVRCGSPCGRVVCPVVWPAQCKTLAAACAHSWMPPSARGEQELRHPPPGRHTGSTANWCVLRSRTQVWDFNRSAEMRDTEGGASKRSVLEQVAKMRKYMAEQAAASH